MNSMEKEMLALVKFKEGDDKFPQSLWVGCNQMKEWLNEANLLSPPKL